VTDRVYLLGAPGRLGGACTEAWHTLRLWRRVGDLDVHVVPTWSMDDAFLPGLESLGIPVHRTTEDNLESVPGLAGSVVVAFCNGHFLEVYGRLRAMGCRLAWANCMCWTFQGELENYRKHAPPEAVIFQSEWQRQCLEPQLREHGYDPKAGHLIRGAFDVDDGWDFDPRPHTPGGDFVLGKLARPDVDKWSSNLWPIYGRVQYRQRKALVMGMDANTSKKLGGTPDWAEWLKPNAMPVRDYYRKIHCLLTVNGGAAENWPRIGLEAFASGVPVVAQREWGWREMIDEGRTGFLASSDEELAHWAAVLAYDEPLRLRIARNARERLVDDLACHARLMAAWQRLFDGVVSGRPS
jgi:hypothetical protein